MKRKAKRIVLGQPKAIRKCGNNLMQGQDGLGTTMPPNLNILLIYFDQKGVAELTEEFFDEHQLRGWKTPTGGTIFNWKVCATEWIFNRRQKEKRRLRQSLFYSGSI